MANIGTLTVALVAQATAFEKTMAQAQRTMANTAKAWERTANRMERVGRSLNTTVSLPLALVGGSAVKMAMDAVESENLFNVALGSMADKAREFSLSLRKQFGLNDYEVRKNIGTLYAMVSSMGLSQNAAYQMSTGLTQLAYDLASFYNLQPETAFEKIRSAIAGETEPLKQLGILVDENTVKQILLSEGIIRQGQELTQQQKVYGRYLAIMKQTTKAQGDLARTLDSPTNKIRIMGEKVKLAALDFGMALMPSVQRALPAVERMANIVSQLAEAFAKAPPFVQNLVFWVGLMAIAAGPLMTGFSGIIRLGSLLVSGIGNIAKFSAKAAFAFASLKGGAATLGEALSFLVGGRLKLVLLGIAAVAAVTMLLISNWKTVTSYAQAAWGVIGAVVLYGASLIVRGIGAILSMTALLIPGMQSVANTVTGTADSLKEAAVQSLDSAKAALKTAQAGQQVVNSQQGVAQAGQQAAQSQDQVAKAIESTAESAQKNLQSFDEVHQIQEEVANSPINNTQGQPDISLPQISLPQMPSLSSIDIGGAISNAWTNAVNTIVDSWNSLKTKALETFPWLKDVINGVSTAIQWAKDNWGTIGPVLETVAGILTALGAAWLVATNPISAFVVGATYVSAVAGYIIDNWGKIEPFVKPLWQNVYNFIVPIWNSLKQTAEVVFNGIKATIEIIFNGIQSFWNVWGETIKAAFSGFWNEIKIIAETFLGVIKGSILTVLALIRGDWEGAWNGIRIVGESIWNGISDTWNNLRQTAYATWQGIVDGISSSWDILSTQAPVVWDSIKSAITQSWDSITEYTGSIWNGIASAISNAWDSVKDTTNSIWQGISDFVSPLWNGLESTASSVWNGISSTVSTAWDSINSLTSTIWNGISSFVSEIWNGIANTASTVWNGISSVASTVWNSIKEGTETVWNGIKTTVTSIWNGISDAASSAWANVKGVIYEVWSAISEKITGALFNIGKALSDKWNEIKIAVSNTWNGIRDTISNTWNSIKASTSTFVTDLKTKLSNMGIALEGIIKNTADKIVGWFTSLKDRAVGAIKGLVDGIIGKATELYNTLVGHSIIPDIANQTAFWFANMKNSAVMTFTDMTSGISNTLGEWYLKFTEGLQRFGVDVKGGAKAVASGFQAVFADAFAGVLDGSMTLSQAFKNVMGNMGDIVKQVLVVQLAQAASKALSSLGTWVLNVLSKVGTAIAGVISQAYATLVAFYAWSGPLAPVLAAGTIGVAIAGIATLANKAIQAFHGVTAMAEGGIVTGPTIALVGEAGPEAVIPLSRDNSLSDSIGQAVYEAVTNALRINQATGNEDREIVLRIDGTTFARLILPSLKKEYQRQGLRLVTV